MLVFGSSNVALKIISEIIENHSEFYGCTNSCNKFVWSYLENIKFSAIPLWKGTSAPVVPFSKGQGQYFRHFTALWRPWNYLWCCYVRALVSPLLPFSKIRGAVPPSCTPVPASMGGCMCIRCISLSARTCQFANTSVPLQTTRPLDTHESSQ